MSVLAIGLLYGAATLLVMFAGMPIAFALGAEVTGIPINGDVNPELLAQFIAALHRYRVLVVPDLDLDPGDLVAFSRRMGPLEIHSRFENTLPAHREVFCVGNVERDGNKHRAMHAEERKQQGAAQKTGRARAHGVDVIEQPDGTTHLARRPDEVRNQNRQRGAHQQGRNQHQQQVDRGHQRQRPVDNERADIIEGTERNDSEDSGCQLNRGQKRQ